MDGHGRPTIGENVKSSVRLKMVRFWKSFLNSEAIIAPQKYLHFVFGYPPSQGPVPLHIFALHQKWCLFFLVKSLFDFTQKSNLVEDIKQPPEVARKKECKRKKW